MHFSTDEIKKLANLSRLALSDAELTSHRGDLEQIISYIKNLQTVDVSGMEAMTHSVSPHSQLRADEAKPVIGQKGLKDSQGYEDGLVKVPKIIE